MDRFLLQLTVHTVWLSLLCGSVQAQPAETEITLSSGRVVTVESVSRMYFSAQDDWALIFNYVTKIPIDNDELLREEAFEIWESGFREMATASGLNYAVTMAFDQLRPRTGVVYRRKFGVVFAKSKNGEWSRLKKPE